MDSNEKTHFLFNMESSPRGIKASRKGVWWMFSFYLNWILWLKPYKTGWKWVSFLSMLSSKHFQTNSSGVPSLWVTAKRILSLCSILCLSRFIFFEVTKLQFLHRLIAWSAWLKTVAFHWKGCNVRSGLSCYPAQKLRWHPRTSGKLLFHGRKATFRGATFRLQNRGSGEKKPIKKPNLPTNCPHHLGALVCDSLPNLNQVGCIDQLRLIRRTHGIRDQDQGFDH